MRVFFFLTEKFIILATFSIIQAFTIFARRLTKQTHSNTRYAYS